MAQIFPKEANKLPLILAAIPAVIIVVGVAFFWYYGSPKYTDAGYRPVQPIEYSHKLHADDLGIDCRYCHSQVEFSTHANIPAVKTCMNCHTLVGLDNPKVEPLRQAWATNTPVEWVRIHKVPDYAYFDHSAHVNAGVSCISCHGNVAQMVEVSQVESLSMGWCLDCHRNPDEHLRPVSEVTNMRWEKPQDHDKLVKEWKKDKNINPPENCSACHR